MRARRLHEALYPLLTLIQLFGVNWISEKRTGRRMLKLAMATMWVVYFSRTNYVNIAEWDSIGPGECQLNRSMTWVMGVANSMCFLTCLLRGSDVASMARLMMRLPMGEGKYRAYRRLMTPPLLFALLSFLLLEFLAVSAALLAGWSAFYKFRSRYLTAGMAAISLYFQFASWLLLPTLAALLCFVACHVQDNVERAMEQITRTESPLRRAKQTSRFVLLIRVMNDVGSKVNRLGSTAAYSLRMTAVLMNALVAYSFVIAFFKPHSHEERAKDSVLLLAFYSPITFLLALYLWFLKMAVSSNQTSSLLAKVLLEDNQRQSRDHISRPHLLRARLVHLAHLIHVKLDRKSFLVLNEEPCREDIIIVFVEMNDFWNMIQSTLPLQTFV